MSIRRTIQAVTACCVVLSPALAQDLGPEQRLFVAHMLAGFEPAMRESFRADIERQAAAMSAEQARLMLSAIGVDPSAPPPALEDPDVPVASLDDGAYHRAQYEPVYRESWQAQKAYDELVAAELASACPDPSGYRIVLGPDYYGVPGLQHQPFASWSLDNDLKVLAGIAPQDGRYDFDFSSVKRTFDRPAVSAAVVAACAAWREVASAFLHEAAPLKAGDPRALSALERRYAARVTPIADALRAALVAAGPSGNEALFTALLSGQPAR